MLSKLAKCTAHIACAGASLDRLGHRIPDVRCQHFVHSLAVGRIWVDSRRDSLAVLRRYPLFCCLAHASDSNQREMAMHSLVEVFLRLLEIDGEPNQEPAIEVWLTAYQRLCQLPYGNISATGGAAPAQDLKCSLPHFGDLTRKASCELPVNDILGLVNDSELISVELFLGGHANVAVELLYELEFGQRFGHSS